MRRLVPALGLVPFLLALSGCEFAEWGNLQRFQEDFSHSYPFKSGSRLYVENFNGSVEIAGWDKETADISGTKYASTENARDALRIDIVTSGDSIRIRTVRPSGHRGNMGARYVIKVPSRTFLDRVDCSNGSVYINGCEGNARVHTSNGRVHVVRLKGSLDASTSNARLEIEEVQGPVTAHTSNGHVNATNVSNGLDVSTSNGGIDASLPSVQPGTPVKLATSNGSVKLTIDSLTDNEIEATTSNASITMHLPAALSANLKARTSNASISTDFDVTSKGQIGKNVLEGTIGGGGQPLILRTSNGSIRLEKH